MDEDDPVGAWHEQIEQPRSLHRLDQRFLHEAMKMLNLEHLLVGVIPTRGGKVLLDISGVRLSELSSARRAIRQWLLDLDAAEPSAGAALPPTRSHSRGDAAASARRAHGQLASPMLLLHDCLPHGQAMRSGRG